jgi:peptidoglycan/LPS O-acetylase OafA/YrhL
MQNSKKIFFPNLDGLRFIAFSMVFIAHIQGNSFRIPDIDNVFLRKFLLLFANGKTGVSIFFVLSGFLITYLILSEIKLNGKLDVIKFYVRRTLRIWPLYFLLLLVIFGIMPLLMQYFHENWKQFDMTPWYYFTFLSNFDVLHILLNKGNDLAASSLTWSVAIEEQFYLIWPLLFLGFNKNLYKFIFPAFVILCYSFRYFNADNETILYFHSISVCGDLALGGWAAYLSLTNDRFKNFFITQSYKQRISFYFFATAVLYVIQFGTHPLFLVFNRLPQTLFFSYIILDQNFNPQTKWKLSNNRFITFWGKYTYGLYLWHAFILMIINIAVSKLLHFSLDQFTVRAVVAILGFVLSLTVSYCSYIWFEAWFLRLKDKFSFIHKS